MTSENPTSHPERFRNLVEGGMLDKYPANSVPEPETAPCTEIQREDLEAFLPKPKAEALVRSVLPFRYGPDARTIGGITRQIVAYRAPQPMSFHETLFESLQNSGPGGGYGTEIVEESAYPHLFAPYESELWQEGSVWFQVEFDDADSYRSPYLVPNDLYELLINLQSKEVDMDEVAKQVRNKQALSASAQNKFLPKERKYEPGEAEYMLDSLRPQPPDGRLAPNVETRLYVPGGLDSLAITRKVIEQGADFDWLKIWLPPTEATQQHSLRRDNPIFRAKTAGQLRSLVGALRVLKQKGEIALPDESSSLVGLPVAGLPGVFVGQARQDSSFNRDMEEFLATQIVQASSFHEIKQGQQPASDLVSKLANTLQIISYLNAPKFGRSQSNHALVAEQDPQAIYDAIRL